MSAVLHPAPRRAPRRGPVWALGAAVLAAHAWLLAWIPGARAPALRPGPAPVPALWTRSLPEKPAVPEALPAKPAGHAAARPMRPTPAAPVPLPTAPSPPAALAEAAVPRANAAPVAATRGAAPDTDPDEPATPPAGGSAPPRYTTRLPAPAHLHFELRRGAQRGSAQLRWSPDGDRYAIAFDAQAGDRLLFEQRSSGHSSTEGLLPERFQDKRRGRGAQHARFEAEAGRIAFSSRAPEVPLWPGAQDRLGWIVQLAGIVAAAPVPPDEVQLYVVGARGGAGAWTFAARGLVDVATPLGTVKALHYDRAPAVLRDQRVEAWLDPARGHWPVKLRFTPVLGGAALELLLDQEPSRP